MDAACSLQSSSAIPTAGARQPAVQSTYFLSVSVAVYFLCAVLLIRPFPMAWFATKIDLSDTHTQVSSLIARVALTPARPFIVRLSPRFPPWPIIIISPHRTEHLKLISRRLVIAAKLDDDAVISSGWQSGS